MANQLLSLGILQGLTEFLPVSSSGHLAIFQNLAGFQAPPLGFDLALHGATLVATLVFFRKTWLRFLFEWLQGWVVPAGERKRGWKVGWARLAGTAVTASVGLPLKGAVEAAMGSLPLVGLLLLINSIILSLAGRFSRLQRSGEVDLRAGLVVGLAQGLAVFPGISRSGSTICSGLFQGLSPEEAFDFSFLMSLPSITGALLLEAIDTGGMEAFFNSLPAGWVLGALAAFVSGIFALALLRRFVVRGKWNLFAIYTAVVGATALLWGLAGRG